MENIVPCNIEWVIVSVVVLIFYKFFRSCIRVCYVLLFSGDGGWETLLSCSVPCFHWCSGNQIVWWYSGL